MKIIEETHTRLVVKHQPIINWLWGSVLFIGGLSFWIYFIFFDFASLHLTCTRSSPPEINCELKRFTLLGRMQKLKLFDPQQAYVQTIIGSKGSKSYKTIVVSRFGDFSLLPNISYQENEQFIIKVNSFINSGESFLIVTQNRRIYLFYISLLAFVFSGFGAFLATSPFSICTFYKSINKVFIERKGLRGNKIIEYPLEEIVRFYIQDKKVKYSRVYRAVIYLKDGKEIPIHLEYTDEQSVKYAVMRIRQFLNIDL
ncbi:hypothetical protein VB713_06705 [Anabaena cylindrica UHCC 0172]|uniref:hypothetical protein n=1 Tax=Anabaena cylindrica TaxID=1165 RepID=UPI002B1F8546|nr:hypothetical protein [Anabaena cylindrica]MEA5550668.1 hypothetical protein [Anabaena cylindrica UHCC 0172]